MSVRPAALRATPGLYQDRTVGHDSADKLALAPNRQKKLIQPSSIHGQHSPGTSRPLQKPRSITGDVLTGSAISDNNAKKSAAI
jgi:hypothetical protein